MFYADWFYINRRSGTSQRTTTRVAEVLMFDGLSITVNTVLFLDNSIDLSMAFRTEVQPIAYVRSTLGTGHNSQQCTILTPIPRTNCNMTNLLLS